MKKFKVKNLCQNWNTYKFMVIRDCGQDGYWYYCCYNDLMLAHKAANEIGNGIVAETSEIEKN